MRILRITGRFYYSTFVLTMRGEMESNKINKKQLLSLVGIVLVILAVMALFRCSIKPTEQTVFSRYYVVTKSTGLYEKLDFDSE